MLNVSTREQADRVIVELAGRLDGGPSCKDLTKAVKDQIDGGKRRFLIDLAAVEWMSSCGIGCLIAAYTSVRRSGGSLALRSPNARVLSALEVTELVPRVFELVDSESEAVTG